MAHSSILPGHPVYGRTGHPVRLTGSLGYRSNSAVQIEPSLSLTLSDEIATASIPSGRYRVPVAVMWPKIGSLVFMFSSLMLLSLFMRGAVVG